MITIFLEKKKKNKKKKDLDLEHLDDKEEESSPEELEEEDKEDDSVEKAQINDTSERKLNRRQYSILNILVSILKSYQQLDFRKLYFHWR